MFVTLRLFALSLLVLCWSAAQAAAPLALLTILDGEAFLLRDTGKLALAEGAALQAEDIIETPPGARLARLEFADGVTLALGPATRALLAPRLKGERGGARVYVLSGWAKVEAPQGVEAAVLSPAVDFSNVATSRASAVLALLPDRSRLFAEAGEFQLRRSKAAPQALKGGELFGMATTADARPDPLGRPDPAFVQAMPRPFRDPLPSRAARFQGKEIELKSLGTATYADAQPWLDAAPSLRRALLPRWRPLAGDAEFRRALVAGMKAHPEWQPVLFPPPAASKKPAY